MLTKRQKQVLEFIEDSINKSGYPPSVREICKGVGLSSTSTVHSHLSKLQELGYIRRDATKPRAIEVLKPTRPEYYSRRGYSHRGQEQEKDQEKDSNVKYQSIPLVGKVTAGEPILADENIEDYYPIPYDFLPGENESFMLRVRGESMKDVGIYDGDFVIVKKQENANNGEIVVALIDEEATVKRFYKEENTVRLEPENRTYSPIYTKEANIIGKVVALFRKI